MGSAVYSFPALSCAAYLTTANIPPYCKSVMDLYVYSSCLSRFLIFDFGFLRHIISIMVKTYKPAQIANAFFELVDEREKPDETIEEIWKFLECEHQVKQIKERVGPIWLRMPSIMMVGLMQWRHSLRTVKERDGNELLDALQDHRDRKKARVAPPSVYSSVKHVFSTTNIVGCLFSRSKIVLSDLRNCILPRHLEDVLYLRVNRHLWNEVDRPQPAPVVEVEEVQEAN